MYEFLHFYQCYTITVHLFWLILAAEKCYSEINQQLFFLFNSALRLEHFSVTELFFHYIHCILYSRDIFPIMFTVNGNHVLKTLQDIFHLVYVLLSFLLGRVVYYFPKCWSSNHLGITFNKKCSCLHSRYSTAFLGILIYMFCINNSFMWRSLQSNGSQLLITVSGEKNSRCQQEIGENNDRDW